jgi:AraC-like DNA-binding protein
MLYRKITPSLLLQPFVECYYIWECSLTRKQVLSVESPPNGYTSFVFNYGDTYQVSSCKAQDYSVPQAFITGQSTKSYQFRLQGRVGMVGVVFKPAGISSLFGLPMYEFVDERTDLLCVLGKSIGFLSERIGEAFNHAEQIGLIEEYLLLQLSKNNRTTDRIDYATNLIVTKNGNIHVDDLAEEACICRRQFERKFLYKVGVSPKYYSRLRRISFLCSNLASQRWHVKHWHDYIHQAGYYDQAHFIKDFTEFTGRSPATYAKNNVELANYFK